MTNEMDRFVEVHASSVVRFAFLLTHDAVLAEDLAQDVFAQVIRLGRDVAGLENPSAYLRRMVVNSATSWRRRGRNREIPSESVDTPASAAMGTEDAFAERDLMWRVLAQLPTRQRAVLVLRFYEGLPEHEIATLLGCAPGTVRSLATRAFSTLRSHPQLSNRTSSGETTPAATTPRMKERS
jgi:RNA polymerase sigma-70 factor (sigma-E family)